MATALGGERCTACHKDAPRATAAEIAQLSAFVPAWALKEVEGVPRLERTFRLPSFRAALDFANTVGDLAEAEDHHPTLLIAWGRVRVTWWTHAIGGLHRNDFVMAAKTDELFGAG